MQRSVYGAGMLCALIAVAFSQPAQAGVSISFTIGDGRNRCFFTNSFAPVFVTPQPAGFVCRPVYPIIFPNGYPCGQIVFVPQAAISGWNAGPPIIVTPPPVIVTSPPSLYGFGSSNSTSNLAWTNRSNYQNSAPITSTVTTSVRPDPQASPSSPKDTILIEKLDDRRILVTWNADNSKVTSAVFYTGDLFKSPLESLRVSQSPYHAALSLNSSMRYVGATVTYNDGTQTTQWVPYSVLD